MIAEKYKIQFITPLFSYGAFQDQPEIRAASIRGQFHWWFRVLGGTPAQESEIFGTVHKSFGDAGKPKASKVVVRVSDIKGTIEEVDTLPHKHGGMAAPKKAYIPGTTFQLHVSFRRDPLTPQTIQQFNLALDAWLRFGSLGLRTTRGAGSFFVNDPTFLFTDSNAVKQAMATLMTTGTKFKMALLDQTFELASAALRVMSDTIGGREESRDQQNSLERIRFPLGAMRPQRKTSPLRFRLVAVGDKYQIVALWDNRQNVTRNSDEDRRKVIRMLVDRDKPIGALLSQSSLA